MKIFFLIEIFSLSRIDEIFKISFSWSQSAPNWLQTQFDEFWAKTNFFLFLFNPLTAKPLLFAKSHFFTGVNSNFEMRLLAIASS